MTIPVRVRPRASRDAFGGVREGTLVVRLSAPPVEGEANAALVRFLARALGVPPAAVSLLRGARGRQKLVRVSGLDLATVRERLQG